MSTAAARELHQDQRGAVMLIGLCMSCFLIGSLWFLIGIGDAIVFRDTMQEASDHAVFTSAALHAKGMNFISACNLIMLLCVIVHILLGIVNDILLAICIISLGLSCGAFYTWHQNVYSNWAKNFKPALTGIHDVEVVAAYTYPVIGLARGYLVGRDYGQFGPRKRDVTTLVVSPSLVPGNALAAPINKLFSKVSGGKYLQTDTNDSKKGLPVSAKSFGYLCKIATRKGLNALVGLTGWSPGSWFDVFEGIVGSVIEDRYCNSLGGGNLAEEDSEDAAEQKGAQKLLGNSIDKANAKIAGTKHAGSQISKAAATLDPGFDTWWGDAGPLIVWGGAINGSPWMQVWSVNMHPEFTDQSEHAVALAERKLGQQPNVQPGMYFSQAEFYFDCIDDWTGDDCDNNDYATFAIRWRARLHRLQLPQVGTLLGSFGLQFLIQSKGYDNLKDYLEEKLIGKLGGFGQNFLGSTAVKEILDNATGFFESKLGNVVDALGNSLNPEYPGIYH